jgi:hypothetical protein
MVQMNQNPPFSGARTVQGKSRLDLKTTGAGLARDLAAINQGEKNEED